VTSQFYGYSAGKIILTSGAGAAGRINIRPTSSMPPAPPSTEAEIAKNALPKEFGLEQNFPNPYNPTTMIHYELPKTSFVRLTVFNILGQEVRTLVNQTEQAGYKSVSFDGSTLASGMYFYKLTAGGFSDVKKMVLLK
jgi:hypothetical protein